MFINRGMDKEYMAHIYTGTLLSHKKKQNCAIWRDVDGPRDCQKEVSHKEKNKYILMRMWNLEKWYR